MQCGEGLDGAIETLNQAIDDKGLAASLEFLPLSETRMHAEPECVHGAATIEIEQRDGLELKAFDNQPRTLPSQLPPHLPLGTHTHTHTHTNRCRDHQRFLCVRRGDGTGHRRR